MYSLHFGYLQDSEYVSFVLVGLCHNFIFDYFLLLQVSLRNLLEGKSGSREMKYF